MNDTESRTAQDINFGMGFMIFDGKKFSVLKPGFGKIKAYAIHSRGEDKEKSRDELKMVPCSTDNLLNDSE